jgi:YbbR domain-containing protein
MKHRRLLSRGLFQDMPVKVICLTAAVILFFFHRINTLTERFFSVPLQVEVPAGFAIASAYPKGVRVTLRGAEESIYPILEEDIEADMSLQAHKTGVFRVPVRVTKKGTALGVEPLEVKVDPQEVTVTLEPLMERKVDVVPDLRGSPAYGFEIAHYTISPQSVMIRGAKSYVQTMNALPTEELDLTGRTEPFVLKAKVLLPNGFVRVVGDASVEFKVEIQETMMAKSFTDIPISALNLSPHMMPNVSIAAGSIQLRGTQIIIEGIKPDQLRLLADFSDVKRTGTYLLRVKPETPSDVTVLDYSPKDVSVELISSGR